MRIAVLYRELDHRFAGNFAQDVSGREDEDEYLSIVAALRSKGHDAFGYCVREERLQDLLRLDCDLAFNLVEEGLNNDSALEPHLPAILDVYGIPYTGGDFLAIATTVDKSRTKEILGFHGVATPSFQVLPRPDEPLRKGLAYPLVVKPLHEDASIGVFRESLVDDEPSLRTRVRRVLRRYRQPAIVEEYVHGRELSVGVIERAGRRFVTPVNEVVFNLPPEAPRIFSYASKWDPDSEEYQAIIPDQCPALDLPGPVEDEIRRVAVQAFDLLRLRGYARIDYRLRDDGRLFVLEVNVNPLIGESSVMATMAARMGWSYPRFINTIAVEAHRRFRRERRSVTLRDLTVPREGSDGAASRKPKSR